MEKKTSAQGIPAGGRPTSTTEAHRYTVSEAVQIRVGRRWRNATVEKLNQRPGFVEVVVVLEDRGVKRRVILDSASPDLRKWGEKGPPAVRVAQRR